MESVNGGQGGVWSGPFGMGCAAATTFDNNTDGAVCLIHDKAYLGLNKYLWKASQQYVYTFNRAWTNEPYVMLLHLDGTSGVYTEILQSDEGLELPICATYGVAAPDLNIDTTILGGRMGTYGYPQIDDKVGEGNRMWKGKMGEFIVFTQKPTQEQEAELIDYLRRKWFKREASPTPPMCLAGTPAGRAKTTEKTSLAMAGGTTLMHAVEAQNLANLTADGPVAWEKVNTAVNGWTFFNVVGDVNFAEGQNIRVDSLPKESATLFTYGESCVFGTWSLLGDGVGSTKVVHRESVKSILLQRNLGAMIIVR